MRHTLLACFCLGLTATAALAHETWIEPRSYQIAPDQTLEADLRNGEKFSGFKLAYVPSKQVRLDIVMGGVVTPVEGRMGDIPAVAAPVADEGLAVVVYVSTQNILRYTEAEKFVNFTTHKDFAWVQDRHRERGLPEVDFREGYIRHAKALVAVGSGQGQDMEVGLETEFVALDNPYLPDFDEVMDVKLLYQGAPRTDTQVEVFDRAPDGTVSITTTRTDAAGVAMVPVLPQHTYMIDAVVMREPTPEVAQSDDIVWQSLWADLTFTVR
ncbi:DUF4198 domain-containing protein [Donghicola mangrovi]|uniref:DUF4198 domain-containing protein n=1 Tax=Donghicola mangrovi TaxID=2729614 RepID=A0A850Q8X5_9RHOB|nr:DUF4198 domain-containing protein [Donghicola mangrovi]NVO22945.1 DUF4198 domain-containing protein [Donghicola mangrovi]